MFFVSFEPPQKIDELRASAAVTGGFNYEVPMIAKITQQLTEMSNFMKQENRLYLKKHQKSAAAAGSNTTERETTPPATNQPAPESPTKSLRQTYESLCKSLVAVLAHTAACAHATAAINAYTQAYYAYIQVIINLKKTHFFSLALIDLSKRSNNDKHQVNATKKLLQ